MKPFDQTDVSHDKLIRGFTYYCCIFIPILCTVLAGWSADHFFFNRFQAIIRWPAVIICALIGQILSLVPVILISGNFENVLNGIRKLMGREPIGRVVSQHEEEKIAGMEKIEQEFTEMDTNNKDFDGVSWEWEGEKVIKKLKPICPKCQYEMDIRRSEINITPEPQSKSLTITPAYVEYFCSKCNFTAPTSIDDIDEPKDLHKAVQREFEYRQRLTAKDE